MLSQQLAQQAYMNAQYQDMAAMNMKPKRYIPLRILLIIACLGLAFVGWRWGIKNVKDAMIEPSAFTASPVDEDEDPADLEAQYAEIRRGADEQPALPDADEITFPSYLYEWFFSMPGDGGDTQ